MKLYIFLLLFLPLELFGQSSELDKRVMRKHTNGKDYVVLYFDKQSDELLKEEVYFSNGKLQWTGSYKNNKENGSWKFYYETGRLKSEETYVNGKEHGTSVEYNEDGKRVKESYWKYGKLVKEQKF